jgi:antitoxin MazE
MKARIQRWGNSLALRIPKAFAAEAGLAEDASVDLSIDRGKLVVNPTVTEPVKLDDLLGAITPDNLHGEWETGQAVGREAW